MYLLKLRFESINDLHMYIERALKEFSRFINFHHNNSRYCKIHSKNPSTANRVFWKIIEYTHVALSSKSAYEQVNFM